MPSNGLTNGKLCAWPQRQAMVHRWSRIKRAFWRSVVPSRNTCLRAVSPTILMLSTTSAWRKPAVVDLTTFACEVPMATSQGIGRWLTVYRTTPTFIRLPTLSPWPRSDLLLPVPRRVVSKQHASTGTSGRQSASMTPVSRSLASIATASSPWTAWSYHFRMQISQCSALRVVCHQVACPLSYSVSVLMILCSGVMEFERQKNDFQTQGDVDRCFKAYHAKVSQTNDVSLSKPSIRSLAFELNRTRSQGDSVLFVEQVAKKAKGFDRMEELRAQGTSLFAKRMHSATSQLPSTAEGTTFQTAKKVAKLAPERMPNQLLERLPVGIQQTATAPPPAAAPPALAQPRLQIQAQPRPQQPQQQPLHQLPLLPLHQLQPQYHFGGGSQLGFSQLYAYQHLYQHHQVPSWAPGAMPYQAFARLAPAAEVRGRRQHCTTCGAPLRGNPACRGSQCRTLSSTGP